MKRRQRSPAVDYPAGFFTALIRASNWPPNFEPRLGYDAADVMRRQAAEKGRQSAAANGNGWGAGTITMPGTPKWAAPKSMMR